MATYQIRDAAPGGATFDCPDDTYILDAAEAVGLNYPYAGRAGADSSSAGFLLSGSVDQSDGSFLTQKQMDAGFILTEVAYPLSNCVIIFNAESFLPGDEELDNDWVPPVQQL